MLHWYQERNWSSRSRDSCSSNSGSSISSSSGSSRRCSSSVHYCCRRYICSVTSSGRCGRKSDNNCSDC